jgi:hypothetical protein
MQEELWIFSQLFLTSSIRGGCFVERLPEGCWFRRARVLSLMPETLESGGRVPEGTSSRIAESIEREFGFNIKQKNSYCDVLSPGRFLIFALRPSRKLSAEVKDKKYACRSAQESRRI